MLHASSVGLTELADHAITKEQRSMHQDQEISKVVASIVVADEAKLQN